MFSLIDDGFLSGLLMGNMMEKGTMTIVTIVSLIAAKVYYKYMIEPGNEDNNECYEVVITESSNENIIKHDFSYQMICIVRTTETDKDYVSDVFFANNGTTELLQLGHPENVMMEDMYPFIIKNYHNDFLKSSYHYFTVDNYNDKFIFSYIPDKTYIGEIMNKTFSELKFLEYDYVYNCDGDALFKDVEVARRICEQIVKNQNTLTMSYEKYRELEAYVYDSETIPSDFFDNNEDIDIKNNMNDDIRPYSRSKDNIESKSSSSSNSSSISSSSSNSTSSLDKNELDNGFEKI